MSAYNATVTRQTEEHVWFVFAQEPLSGESFAPRGGASFNVDDSIVVRNVDTGLWFVASGGSMAAQPEDEIPAPPQLSARLSAGRAVFSWAAPTESATYSLHLQRLQPSVLAPRTFTGLASGDGRFSAVEPDVGFYSVWLSDRGVAGPRTFFSVSAPKPPSLMVTVGAAGTVFAWAAPAVAATFTLSVQRDGEAGVNSYEGLDSSSGSYTLPTGEPGGYTAWLEDRGVEGDATSFTVLPPPKPPSLAVSVGRRTTVFKWLAPADATVYTLLVQSLETLAVSSFEGLDSGDGGYTAGIVAPGSYRAWLVDRGVEGDRTEFTVEPAPTPPALRVSVDGLVATFVWDAPDEVTDYTLQLQSTAAADAEIVGSASFGSGLERFVVTLSEAGSWRAWLRDRTSDGPRVMFTTSVPPEEVEDDGTPPALRLQSVMRHPELFNRFGSVIVEFVWDIPLIETVYRIEVHEGRRASVSSGLGRYVDTLPGNRTFEAHLEDGDKVGPTLEYSTTPPPYPAIPSLVADVDGNYVRVEWTSNGDMFNSYRLLVSLPNSEELQIQTGTGGTPVTSDSRSGALGGFGDSVRIDAEQHSFFLRRPGVYTTWLDRRVNSGREAGPKLKFTILPAAPAPTPPALTADPRDFTVLLTWQTPDEQLSRTYSVQTTQAGGAEFMEAATRAASVGQYLATFTGAGTYMARLVDSGVAGHAVAFTLPAARPLVIPPPPRLSITTNGFQAILRWPVPSVATSYDVQLTAAGGSVFSTVASSVSSRLGFYTVTLSEPGRYEARLVDGVKRGGSDRFTISIPAPPELHARASRSQMVVSWLVPPWKRTYTLQIREPGETSFRDFAENLDSDLGVYTAALISEGDYAVRLADGAVVGLAATFTISSQIPEMLPPSISVSSNRGTARFTWQRPLFDRLYTLEIQEPGDRSFRRFAENVDSSLGQYVATFIAEGDYRARFVDGTLLGPPVSFRIGSQLPVVTPPTMDVSVSGLAAVFTWQRPLFDTTYSIEIDTPGGDSSFSSVATGIPSGSAGYTYSGGSAGAYRARLALGALKGGITSFRLEGRLISSLPAVTATVRSGFEVTFGWPTRDLGSNSYVLEVQEPGSSSYRTLSVFPGGELTHRFLNAGAYKARLRAGSMTGAAASFTLSVSATAATPPALMVTKPSQVSVRFTWKSPTVATRYRLEVASVDGGGFSYISPDRFSSTYRDRRDAIDFYVPRAGRYQARLVDDGVQGAVTFFEVTPKFPFITHRQIDNGDKHVFSWDGEGFTPVTHVFISTADGSFERLVTSRDAMDEGVRLPERGAYLERAVYIRTRGSAGTPERVFIEGPVRGFVNEAIPPTPTVTVAGGLVRLSWQPPLLKTTYRLQLNSVIVKSGIDSDDGGAALELTPDRSYTVRLVAGNTVEGATVAFRTASTPPTPTVVVEGSKATISWDAPSVAAAYNVQLTGADGRIYATVARNVPSGDESVKVDVLSGRRYSARLSVAGELNGERVVFNTPPALSAAVTRSQVTFRWDFPSRHEVYKIRITSPTDSSFMRTFSNVYSRWGRFITDLRTAGSYRAVIEGSDGVGPAVSFAVTDPSPPPLQVATSSRQATFLWAAPRTATTYRIVTTSPDNSSVNLRSLELASRLQRHRIQLPASGRYQSQLVSSGGSGPTVDYTILPELSVSTMLRSVALRWTAPVVDDTFDVQVTFQGTFIYQTLASDVDSSLGLYSFSAPSAGVYHARLADETGFSNALRFTIRI